VKRRGLSADSDSLRAFWALFHLRSGERRCVLRTRYARWRPPEGSDLIVSQYVTDRSVGVFLRGPRGEGWRQTAERLQPWADGLSAALDTQMGRAFLFPTRTVVDTADDANWTGMADFMHTAADRYVTVLERLSPAPQMGEPV
jgi:hypothetical protein